MKPTNILLAVIAVLVALAIAQLYFVDRDIRNITSPVQCGDDYNPCNVRVARP